MAFPPTTPCKSASTKRLKARTRSHRVLHLVAYPSTIKAGWACSTNGNNPLQPHTARASFRLRSHPRRHPSIFTTNCPSSRPKNPSPANSSMDAASKSFLVFESGQPYNVYDFSGSVGGQYYSANDFIHQPCSSPWHPALRPDCDRRQRRHGMPFLNPAASSPATATGQEAFLPASHHYRWQFLRYG